MSYLFISAVGNVNKFAQLEESILLVPEPRCGKA